MHIALYSSRGRIDHLPVVVKLRLRIRIFVPEERAFDRSGRKKLELRT